MDNSVDYITSFSELSIGDIKMFVVLLTWVNKEHLECAQEPNTPNLGHGSW